MWLKRAYHSSIGKTFEIHILFGCGTQWVPLQTLVKLFQNQTMFNLQLRGTKSEICDAPSLAPIVLDSNYGSLMELVICAVTPELQFVSIYSIEKLPKSIEKDRFLCFLYQTIRSVKQIQASSINQVSTVSKSTQTDGPLVEITCDICLELMSTPTSICVNGHSVCFQCKLKVKECPHCRDCFIGRNYKLNQVIDDLYNDGY